MVGKLYINKGNVESHERCPDTGGKHRLRYRGVVDYCIVKVCRDCGAKAVISEEEMEKLKREARK